VTDFLGLQVSHLFLTRPIDRVVVVGKSVPTELHELVSTQVDATQQQRDACTAFREVWAFLACTMSILGVRIDAFRLEFFSVIIHQTFSHSTAVQRLRGLLQSLRIVGNP
jgi:hypothetical protein